MTSNDPDDTCNAPLPPQAVEGFHLFNAGKYFEAHEALPTERGGYVVAGLEGAAVVDEHGYARG